MPSTYTSNNKIQKIATGEQSGTWGNTTNTNFDLFDTAIDGFVSIALSGTTYSLNIPDGTASDARNKVISFTGTLAAANTVTVTPNTVEKLYFFQNNTTGGQNVIIAQGSGSTVTIKPGYSSIVYLNGAGSGAAVKEVLTSLKLTALLEATGVVFVGSGSGNTTLQAAATASGTLTLPAATDTIVGRSTTDTLSNKTLATPIITTNATVPLLIGGTGVLSTLTLRSTSGVGTTGADIVFQTGTNGATEVMRLQNGGNIGIATATPAQKLEVYGATSLPATSGTTQNGLVRIASTATNAIDCGLSNASPFGAWIQTSNVTSLATTYPLLLNPNGGNVGIGTTNPAYQLQLSTDSAAKPSTNTWTIASDARLKTVLGDYEKGVDAICALRPVRYQYNGKAGFITDGKEQVSILAQELMQVFPECVGTFKGKLEEYGPEVDLYNYNGHAITFALINAIKELKVKIDALENRK